MAESITWEIPSEIWAKDVELSFRVKNAIASKDFVLSVDVNSVDEFMNTNPHWFYSEKLATPFVYVPEVKVTPSMHKVKSLRPVPNLKGGTLTMRRWGKQSKSVEKIFDLLVASTSEPNGTIISHYLKGATVNA